MLSFTTADSMKDCARVRSVKNNGGNKINQDLEVHSIDCFLLSFPQNHFWLYCRRDKISPENNHWSVFLMKTKSLTKEQIDSKLRYCSSTGHFYRISNGKIAGGHRSSGGRVLSVGGVKCSEHILAWIVNYGQYPSEPIFHKNGDLSDNRISNLCTKSLMRFNFVMSILSKKD